MHIHTHARTSTSAVVVSSEARLTVAFVTAGDVSTVSGAGVALLSVRGALVYI